MNTSEAPPRQGCPQPPGARGGEDQILPSALLPLDFGLLASRTGRGYVFVVLSHPCVVICYRSHRTLIQTPTNRKPNALSLHQAEPRSSRPTLRSDLGVRHILLLELLVNRLCLRQDDIGLIHFVSLRHGEYLLVGLCTFSTKHLGFRHQRHGFISQPYTCYGLVTSDSCLPSVCCTTEGTGAVSLGGHEYSMK